MREEKTAKLSNKDIVLYALHHLGGWQRRVHTEAIALKCYELAPSKFSWVKYPQYPDLSAAYHALGDAKKPKYGALVKGESEKTKKKKGIGGWMLTADGIKWTEANKERIEKYLGEHRPIGDRLPADRKLKELLRSTAFKKFKAYGEQAEISHADFAESLVCTVNTRSEVLNDRLEQLYSIAEKREKEDVKNYVNSCRKKFAALLEKGE